MLRAIPRLRFFLAATLFLNFSASPQDRLLTLDDLYDPEKRVNFSGNSAGIRRRGWPGSTTAITCKARAK
jgi:hypothetical protein